MAKKRASKARKSVSRSRSSSQEVFGVKFDSLTFLLFSVFVLIVSVMLVSRMMGMNFY